MITRYLFPFLLLILVIVSFGFLPAIIRRLPVQRTWLVTVVPFSLLMFMITADGEFLNESKDITIHIITMCIVFGACWYATNALSDVVRNIKFTKGDMSLELKGQVDSKRKPLRNQTDEETQTPRDTEPHSPLSQDESKGQ